MFKGPVDFKNEKDFNKLVGILKAISKNVNKGAEKEGKPCGGCNSQDYQYLYRTNKCENCVMCERCEKDVKISKRCPVCSTDFFNEIIVTKLDQARSDLQRNVSNFKSNLNRLIMDVIVNLCFENTVNRANLPNAKVVERIIELLLPKPLIQMLNQPDPNAFDFNLNPSIKSNIFQLLLNYNQNEVESHLDNIFSKSVRFIKENYKKDDLTSIKLMYVNSIEDSLYSKSSFSAKDANNLDIDVSNGIQHLNYLNQMDINDSSLSKIEQFKLIAKIKFCLVTCAKLVNEFKENNDLFHTYLALTREFLNNNKDCLNFQFFLIKQIFRRFGKQNLVEASKDKLFKWIIPKNILDSDSQVRLFSVFFAIKSFVNLF
jgi:hypothetical protein